MLPTSERNIGSHVLDMPVRVSVLAAVAHVPLDRRTMGACTLQCFFRATSASKRVPELSKVIQEQLTRHHSDEAIACIVV